MYSLNVNARQSCFFQIHYNCLKLAQIPFLPVGKHWGNLGCVIQYGHVPSMESWLNFSCSAWLSYLLCKSLCACAGPPQKCIISLTYLIPFVVQHSVFLSSDLLQDWNQVWGSGGSTVQRSDLLIIQLLWDLRSRYLGAGGGGWASTLLPKCQSFTFHCRVHAALSLCVPSERMMMKHVLFHNMELV